MENREYQYIIEELFLQAEEGKIFSEVADLTERLVIEKGLQLCGGNQVAAAKMLGINRNTVRDKINRLKIEVGRFK